MRPQGTTASVQPPFVTSVAAGAPGRRREPGNQTEHALAGPRGTDSPSALCWLPPREETNSPAEDDVVVEEVHLDVLQANGLIEALRDEEPQEPTQVRRVEKRDADLFRKSLQEREQHRARVLPS